MNANELLDLMGEARQDYVLSARQAMEARRVRRLRMRRLALIAAIVSLMVFLLGCAVVVLRLQDFKIGEMIGTRYQDENGEFIRPTEVTRDVISLRGYKDSPNYAATREWYEFEQSYDPDKSILIASFDDPEPLPEGYAGTYGCYTAQMAEKVDEIAQKYDLKLLGPTTVVQRWQNRVMFDAMGIDGVCKPDAAAYIREGSGYFCAEGNFKYEFDFTLNGEDAAWPYMICATMLYSQKDYFDPAYTIVDTQWYDQWTYTTADGTEILIAMGREGALLFAEQADAYITVTLDTALMRPDEVADTPTREAIRQAAEVIDFSLCPQLPDMEGLEEKLAEADRDYEAQREAEQARAAAGYPSYAAYIRENFVDDLAQIAGTPEERKYYALLDANGDGVEDLLLGRRSDTALDLLTIKDGKVVAIHRWGRMTLCEGNILKAVEEADYIDRRVTITHYYQLDSRGETHILSLYHEEPADSWHKQENGEYTLITEAEAREISEQFTPIPVEMKPITEFAMP